MRYSAFGALSIPDYDASQDYGGDATLTGYVQPPGRPAYDTYGTARVPRDGREVTISGVFVSSSMTALDTLLDTWRAVVGTRGLLTVTLASAATRTRYARLTALDLEIEPGPARMQRFSMTYRLEGDIWLGTAHVGTGDDLVTLNTSPKVMTINNAGNAPVYNAVLTLTAGAANITAVTIANAATGYVSSVTYTGTVTAGQALVLDAGAWTVKNNGVDAYAGITYGATHAVDGLLVLGPGNNSITITLTGGSTDSTAAYAFHDGWS
jgi:hypothetical protein